MSTFSGSLTFNGKEARTGVVLPAFQKPLFTQTMKVVEGVKAKEQIAFIGRLTKVMKASQACGTLTATNKSGIPLSEKFWNPVPAELFLPICGTELTSKFFVWGLAKGYERADLTKAATGDDSMGFMSEFIMDLMSDAVYEDVMRMLWFSDVDITDITDSPAGVLGSATDTPYYNLLDGYWKQIYAGVAGGSTPRYTISANAGVSYAAQALADGASYTILKNLVDNADARLADQPDQVILVTKTIFDNWIAYRESKNLESATKDQALGIAVAQFRGIPIIPINLWDRYIKSDFDNTVTYDKPHRAIYSSLSNIMAAFDVAPDNAPQVIDFWYDKDTKYNKMRGEIMIDAKIALDELVSVAY